MENNTYTFVCRDCGISTTIDRMEIEWFKNHGYALPIRDKNCRDLKKRRNEQFEQNSDYTGRGWR